MGGLDSEENENPLLEESKERAGLESVSEIADLVQVNPSTVKNEGKVREAPQEVSKFEAFQEEDEL